MSEIEYFYAAHSAYAYFGHAKFMDIAKAAGRAIVHRPVDLDRVLEGAGSVAFRHRSLKVRNYFFNREMERWVEYWDLEQDYGRSERREDRGGGADRKKRGR